MVVLFVFCEDSLAERLRRSLRNLLGSPAQVQILQLSIFFFASKSISFSVLVQSSFLFVPLLMRPCQLLLVTAQIPFGREQAQTMVLPWLVEVLGLLLHVPAISLRWKSSFLSLLIGFSLPPHEGAWTHI